jgi:thiol-disulfide isomerase/thioredoxin
MANIPTLKVDSTWVVIAGVVLLLIFFLGTPSFRIWSPSFNLHHRLGAATFTMFGTEWCGACKQARPEFDKLGPTVTSGGKTVTIRFVNHETERELAKGYEILGYPTFYLDMDGKRTKYEGPRTEQGFRQFLQ